MQTYEYRVVAAPSKGGKAKGVKGAEERFAHTLEALMNEMALEGWEYQRAETLPSEERSGLASSHTVWRNLLIFRRAVGGQPAAVMPPMTTGDAEPEPQPDTPQETAAEAPAQAETGMPEAPAPHDPRDAALRADDRETVPSAFVERAKRLRAD
ncbi:hypothetical protein [Salipiger mucosus]|uniref:DUF4177 domain-containing protein n=1 Tax=Salipiger mucosus DSM 16094 TaxID=1123237 RepID=S9RW29_9RHOB|nr:hypothetical protein [Salipiger mucosus]EPX82220.1 hypothetical protein Salmuc_05477 [Salipiger mucosus DSM 16094]